MEKGINLQIEEFKINIATALNESQMPPSIMELVLQGFLTEIGAVNRQQIAKENQEFQDKETI